MKNLVASLLIGSLAQASWAAPASAVIDVYKSPTCAAKYAAMSNCRNGMFF